MNEHLLKMYNHNTIIILIIGGIWKLKIYRSSDNFKHNKCRTNVIMVFNYTEFTKCIGYQLRNSLLCCKVNKFRYITGKLFRRWRHKGFKFMYIGPVTVVWFLNISFVTRGNSDRLTNRYIIFDFFHLTGSPFAVPSYLPDSILRLCDGVRNLNSTIL